MPSVPVELACLVRGRSPQPANPVCCRYAGQALSKSRWIWFAHAGRAHSGGGENTMRIAGGPRTCNCSLRLLSTAALAVTMTVGLAGAGLAQDATPTAMDDDTGVAYPSHLHSGDCDNLSAEPVQRLADLLLPDWVAGLTEGDDTDIVAEDFGNPPIPVAVATTEVNIPLADIVAGKHAIDVERPNVDDAEDSVACANIGGVVDEHGDLFVGLSESNGSGHNGIIWLHDNGTSTTIVAFLAHPGEAAGIETALAALAAAEEEAAATPMATSGATPVADADATPVT